MRIIRTTTLRGNTVKPSDHIPTTHHVIPYAAVLPLMPTEGSEPAAWRAPSVVAIGVSVPESATIGAGLYTDLQTAMAFAEQMRQLIAIYRSLYGEFYARPQPRN